MGFRQGETLGLHWSYVDLEAELFRPEWLLQRLTWRHGCDDPHVCGGRLHRFEPCPPDCITHKGYKRGCPEGVHQTLASTAGASTRELMTRMGHSSSRAALIYQHMTSDRVRAIAERLGAMIRCGGGVVSAPSEKDPAGP
ncbi:hypothetical protein TNCT6_35180 [Streptomyces sp. 6-11-2]|nr:hypothetical protein TNCT6_35180 [Streptomyces sp. 6-11-2]